jgi:hypothetical protein
MAPRVSRLPHSALQRPSGPSVRRARSRALTSSILFALACGGDPISEDEAANTGAFPGYLQRNCDTVEARPPAQENVAPIAGEAGVSGGAASYRIPITIAPGRRGVEPEVALSYSSRAGSGVVGVGFSLSATSQIARCPRTVTHDAEASAVRFTPHDRLCLDGQRLIAVRGVYGTHGSQYRTEIDSFARITLLGDMSNPSSQFAVEAKSGRISYYGAVCSWPSHDSFPKAWKRMGRREHHNRVLPQTCAMAAIRETWAQHPWSDSGERRHPSL